MGDIAVAKLQQLPNEQEIHELWGLAGQLYSDLPDLAEVEANIASIVASDSRELFVARAADIIVGQLVLTEVVEPGVRYGYIGGVVVDSMARGQGVAPSLVTAAIGDGLARGLTRFDLTTSKPPAQRLYQRIGFDDVETNLMRLRTRP